MDNDKVERDINEGWYFFIDIVGASDSVSVNFMSIRKN